MVDVTPPPMARLPRDLVDRQPDLAKYLTQLNRILLQLWTRTGGTSDNIEFSAEGEDNDNQIHYVMGQVNALREAIECIQCDSKVIDTKPLEMRLESLENNITPLFTGLEDTSVTAGSYTSTDLTVDSKGRIIAASNGSSGGGSYMIPIWAEENSTLGNNTYEWAFGNGANTPSNNGISIYIPSTHTCSIVAMSATTNNASGSSVIEANINGVLQGVNCNVTLAGRSATNDTFTPVALSNADRLTFRTTTAGVNSSPNTVCAWLKYTAI